MDPPPTYMDATILCDPPEYSPAVHHLSLIYYADESKAYIDNKNNHTLSYIPLVFEINSTQINLYNIKNEYSRIVAHLFNDLNTNFVDPNLNMKSKHSSKVNFIGQGIGSSTNLFNNNNNNNNNTNNNTNNNNNIINNINNSSLSLNNMVPSQPQPLLTSDSFSSSNSITTMFSSLNNSSSPQIPTVSRNSSFSSTTSSFSKFLDKLSLKKQPSNPELLSSYNYIILSESERKSQDLIYIHKLLNYKQDINSIVDTDYSPQEAQLLNFKSNLFKSFSLQELVKFGNASDFHLKPYSLRLIFSNEQFLIISYNANSFASIFYKLNIGRELSLDIDLRVPLPLDYCVPRRSRGRNRNRRNRSSTLNSLRSFNSITRSTTNNSRSRSNSLLNDDADDDDEFDTTFNIDNPNSIDYQPQPSIQPQIILEDEILNDIIQLEPAQQIISARSTNSSVFSSVERYSSQITDLTLSSLTPISSENEILDEIFSNVNLNSDSSSDSNSNSNSNPNLNSTSLHELPRIEKLPITEYPHSAYRELVFAIKCIKSCKNKTIPWFG